MIKAPVTFKHNGDRLCMYDANGEYLFSDFDLSTRQLNDVARALNDGERYKIALETIAKASHTWNQIVKIAADALREGAGDGKGR